MALPTRRDNEGSSRPSEVEAPVSGFPRTVPLTVKLSGRPKECPALRTRTLSSARSERKQLTCHGPLQRLLEVTHRSPLCACGPAAASQGEIVSRLSAPLSD